MSPPSTTTTTTTTAGLLGSVRWWRLWIMPGLTRSGCCVLLVTETLSSLMRCKIYFHDAHERTIMSSSFSVLENNIRRMLHGGKAGCFSWQKVFCVCVKPRCSCFTAKNIWCYLNVKKGKWQNHKAYIAQSGGFCFTELLYLAEVRSSLVRRYQLTWSAEVKHQTSIFCSKFLCGSRARRILSQRSRRCVFWD